MSLAPPPPNSIAAPGTDLGGGFTLGPTPRRRKDDVPPPKTVERPRDLCWVWDVPFDRVDMPGAVDVVEDLIENGGGYAITANVHYTMLHRRHADVREITAGAALIVADGQPIVWRSRLTQRPLPARVPGSEMIDHLTARAAEKRWPVYFLGGAEGVPEACAEELSRRHPGLTISGAESPPFRDLTDAEQDAQIRRIVDGGSKLVLVAFGQPKGERWIARHHHRLNGAVCLQLGASFDFIAGTSHRAPPIYHRLGMEWFHRMVSDPRRLVPRYTANACFLIEALIGDWRKKVTGWGLGRWT